MVYTLGVGTGRAVAAVERRSQCRAVLYRTQDDGTVIVLCFAELKGPVNDQFTLLSEIGRSHVLPTGWLGDPGVRCRIRRYAGGLERSAGHRVS